MGLDCSHGAWTGAYSAFNSFRQVVCAANGGSFPPHSKYDKNLDPDMIYFKVEDGVGVEADVSDGLMEFLMHSDCDGEISPELCGKVADDLEKLLPKIEAMTGTPWSGHVQRDGGYVAVTKRFISGCRKAAAKKEPLEFA